MEGLKVWSVKVEKDTFEEHGPSVNIYLLSTRSYSNNQKDGKINIIGYL